MSSLQLPGVLAEHPIVPVVVIDDPSFAADLGAALSSGGIGCAEVTLRTAGAFEAMAAMAASGSVLVGAGTVLTEADVERSAAAGARFIVAPGFDERIVDRARDLGLAVLPGAATATEVTRAVTAGLDAVKFFPAGTLGGLAMIDALSGPFANTAFVPSGGVNLSNLTTYLAHRAVPAVSGSWMVDRSLLAARDVDAIARLSREASTLAAEAASR